MFTVTMCPAALLMLGAFVLIPALPLDARAASQEAASLQSAASVDTQLTPNERAQHRKQARHHRQQAAHHRGQVVLSRKRAKHMRTLAMILGGSASDVVLQGSAGKAAAKLLEAAAAFELAAEKHEAEAIKHEALADLHAALGAPKASFGVDAASVQVVHQTGALTKGAALLVRRGRFVRMGLQVGEGCVSPGFQLRDVASNTTLTMPLLSRADGLALTAGNREGLAAKDPAKADAVYADMAGSLGGVLSSESKTQSKADYYAERVAAGGSPFYAVIVERVSVPAGNGTEATKRAAVALWLPEHTPFGGYELRFACDGQPITAALPMVVLFNPFSATTAEYVADKGLLKTSLRDTERLAIGPLQVPFTISADWEARDAALGLAVKLPLSARAHAALVARLARRGPIQLTGRASYAKQAANMDDAAAVVAKDVLAWSDATGHFDLWQGGIGSTGERPGRWSTAQSSAEVVFGSSKEEYALGAKGKGLVGRWTFDDSVGQDDSGLMNKAGGGKPLPKHTTVKVSAVPHFVDDWAGESAFLKLGTGAYDSAFVAGETNATQQSKQTNGADSQGAAGAAATKTQIAAGNSSPTKPASDPTSATQAQQAQPSKAGDANTAQPVASADTKPWEWSDTTEILTTYRKGGDARVKYGQCWVFAGLGTAMTRGIGIPTRTATNFDAAHEHKTTMPAGVGPYNGGFLTTRKDGLGEAKWAFETWLETYVGAGGSKEVAYGLSTWNSGFWKETGESVWNFHVWSEVYTANASGVGGWADIDSTPMQLTEAWLGTATIGAKLAISADQIGEGPAGLDSSDPAVWFYPGHKRLHIRSSTVRDWNHGLEPSK